MSGHIGGSPLKSPQHPLSFWIECRKKQDGWIRYESKRRRPRPFTDGEKGKDKHRKILHSSIFSTGCNSMDLPLSTLSKFCTSASAPTTLPDVHYCKCSNESPMTFLLHNSWSEKTVLNIFNHWCKRSHCKCLQLQISININANAKSFPWLSFCRFLGQHQQMFKLFEKVLPTFCVTSTSLILALYVKKDDCSAPILS